MEGVVVEWSVKLGDYVNVDDMLCEVETDKANTEIPSPVAGYVTKFIAEIDEPVEVGEALVEISDQKPEGLAEAPAAAPMAAAPAPATAPAAAPVAPAASSAAPSAQDLQLARSNGEELSTPALVSPQPTALSSSAATGSWTQRVSSLPRHSTPAAPPAPVAAAPAAKKDGRWVPFGHPAGAKAYRYPKPLVSEGDTVEKFSRRRQIIAEHMVISQAVSPHVVTVAEVDMTDIVKLRNANKVRLKSQGINVTYLSFLLKATVEALTEFPAMNSIVGDKEVILKKAVHLGCAVETPAGLVVPVIRNADQLNMIGLANSLTRLAKKARDGVLEPQDVSGGTFTVSNPGLKGNLYGGAIINQPQVGIVRMGEIKKRPMVVTRDGQDVIAIRNMMYIALSYDHRVVDGVTGNAFLFRIRELLEKADFSV
jgi:2-oxoglutarate dehydrogenase E2 component (dihydrolipoamide succinyltransferase)